MRPMRSVKASIARESASRAFTIPLRGARLAPVDGLAARPQALGPSGSDGRRIIGEAYARARNDGRAFRAPGVRARSTRLLAGEAQWRPTGAAMLRHRGGAGRVQAAAA